MKDTLKAVLPQLTDEQSERFCAYYALLTEWNKVMNLTAITEKRAVAEKHFYDSLAAEPLLFAGARLIDVGTGAGFPGVPLLIMRPDLSVTLLDSLGKRIRFLETVVSELGLSADCVHMRAEDAGRSQLYRAGYDFALTRAVAPLNVLSELTLPLVKVGGASICYKGAAAEELTAAARALTLLRARAEALRVEAAYGERTLLVLHKEGKTAAAYPRKAGTPEKNPL